MRGKFIIYALVVTLGASALSWGSMARVAGSGLGSGNSWRSSTGGLGYIGGGFGSSSGGGHK